MTSQLQGRKALLVEDETLVAMLVEDMLQGFGCSVRVAARLSDAVAAARDGDFDFAVLDVNLGGEASYPAADILHERGVPLIFATSYGGLAHPLAYQEFLTLQKPYGQDELERLLLRMLGLPAAVGSDSAAN